MKISSYGHACFKIKCKDLTLLIDPYDNTIGLKLPKVKADVILTTHNHHDHNNISVRDKETIIIDGPGEYEVKGTFIYGKEAFHDNKKGEERGIVTMYLIEDDKVRIAHLGDLGQKQLSKEQLELLQGLQNEFNQAKINIADTEIKKAALLNGLSEVQKKFAEQEQILMKEFGENAVINLQTGEVKDPEPVKEEETDTPFEVVK